MPDNHGADLHQPVAQRGERPVLDLLGQRQGAQEVGEVVGQRVQLQPHSVGGEPHAGQPRPGNRGLAFLDVQIHRAALVVEGVHPLGRAAHVGHDEPYTRVGLADH